jgi:hypothetical protein
VMIHDMRAAKEQLRAKEHKKSHDRTARET